MFNQLKALLDIRKEVPDAVGYEYDRPYKFPIPKELQFAYSDALINSMSEIAIASIRVDNYSSNVQRDIRILYAGGWQYAPNFRYSRREVDVKYELRDESKEIVIAEIPPNETVYISVFNPTQFFSVEQVLIGEKVVSDFMRRLAANKRYPDLRRSQMLAYACMAVALIATVGVLYAGWTRASDNRYIEAAIGGENSCSSIVFRNTPAKAKELESLFNRLSESYQRLYLHLNKVASFDDLKQKEKIILCE